MTEKDESSADLVLSYVVNYSGVNEITYEPVKKALSDGYRIMDVLQIATSIGGQSTGNGDIVITVILTRTKMSQPYVSTHRQA